MRTSRRVLTLLLAVALLALPSAQAATGFTVVKTAKRTALPAWSGVDVNGSAWATKQARGRVTVVNLWASWCPPCQQEWPELQAAADALPKVRFVGINTMDNASNAAAFLESHASSYLQVLDERSVLQSSLTTVPNRSLPITMVIDTKGRIAAWKAGPLTRDQLLRAVYAVISADARVTR